MADNEIYGEELWVTDGTENGTMLLKDIFQGKSLSWPEGFIEWTKLGDKLIFPATDGVRGEELWQIYAR